MTVWQPDVLTLIGDMIWETEAALDMRHVLQASYHDGATVAGICGGRSL